jgi:Raf kinase inhibitor-like YbhB/YbcL family protein
MAFALSSPVTGPNVPIPKKYTCDGADVSMPLEWQDPPKGARSFALVADDPDAPGRTWVHWVIYNLPADARRLPEGVPTTKTLPDGSGQGMNDFGRLGYGGPCPPPGRPHRYVFTLYALDAVLATAPGASKASLLKAMAGHVLGQAQWTGRYGR